MGDDIAVNKEAVHDIAAKKKEAAQQHIDQDSRTGDIELLYRSLRLLGKILHEIDKEEFIDTPLHTAARMGHSEFCAEVMNLMPSFGKRLNPDGFSPLHLALQQRHHDTALTLVAIDKELVRVKGKHGITPLMYCAQSDDCSDTLAMFLRDCPQAIFDESTRFETALHVALKKDNGNDAVMILNWLRRSSTEKCILDWKDSEGNTPLHLATKNGHTEAVKMLVTSSRLNKRNLKKETPLDIALDHLQNWDQKTIKLLKRNMAKKSKDLPPGLSYAKFLQRRMTCWEKGVRYYTSTVIDLDVGMRNVILVVAALIAAATYTAMLQPPGGLYQASADTTANNLASSSVEPTPKSNTSSIVEPKPERKPKPGKMLMDTPNYQRFMPVNTLAFTLAIVVIVFVLPAKPYTLALQLSLVALSYSCLIAMHFVSADTETADISFFLAWSLLALASGLKFKYFLLKGLVWGEWWMPNFILEANTVFRSSRCNDSETPSLNSKLRKQYKLTVSSLKSTCPC